MCLLNTVSQVIRADERMEFLKPRHHIRRQQGGVSRREQHFRTFAWVFDIQPQVNIREFLGQGVCIRTSSHAE